MLEKIRNLGNLPLVIVLIVVVIVAIVLSIVKSQKSDETNADTYVSEGTKQEELEEEETEEEEEIFEENVQEIVDETEEVQNVDAKYFIRVNYGQNVVTIYTKDSNGEYTVPYKAMVCSTGTATPRSGTYTMPSGTYSRGTWGMMIGNVWAQYFTRIKGSILFHSVPYTERNKWSLEYWEYDKLGTAASAGCIRLTVEDAKWIYNNCPAGTKVEFYTDSNPEPIIPKQPAKISEEEEVRGWDPTDPDASNPWKTYTPSEEKEEEPEENTTTTGTTTKPTTQTPTTPSTSTTPDKSDEGNSSGSENTTPNEGNNSGNETITPSEGNTSEESKDEDESNGNTSDGETTNGNEGENQNSNEGETEKGEQNPDDSGTSEKTPNVDEETTLESKSETEETSI